MIRKNILLLIFFIESFISLFVKLNVNAQIKKEESCFPLTRIKAKKKSSLLLYLVDKNQSRPPEPPVVLLPLWKKRGFFLFCFFTTCCTISLVSFAALLRIFFVWVMIITGQNTDNELSYLTKLGPKSQHDRVSLIYYSVIKTGTNYSSFS